MLCFSLLGQNWSSNSTISVSKHLKRRHITLKLSHLRKLGHTNLVFKLKNTKKSVKTSKNVTIMIYKYKKVLF